MNTDTLVNREHYPSDWVVITLMVSPLGTCHAVSGERAKGNPDSDLPYIGLERIDAKFAQTQLELKQAKAELSTLAARLERMEKRLHWLHDCSTGTTDPQGFEWGIYRVKWENGKAAEVWQTASDFSDLDAEMARELEPPCPDCAKAMKKHASLDARMAQRGNFGIVPLPMKCAKHLTNITAGEERK